MKTLFTIIFLLSITILHGQYGFNQTYEMNSPGSAFHNVIWDGEHIVVAGTVSIDSLNQWGLLFTQLDTLGNVVNQKVYTDSSGDDYIFNPNYSIINTSDGGYAMVGSLWDKEWGFMAKLDAEGGLEFLQEYPDTLSLIRTTYFKRVIELPDGYLIAGTKQIADYTSNVFALKTDLQGTPLWEKKYGVTGNTNVLGAIQFIDNNTYLLGGVNAAFPNGSPFYYNEDWGQGWIFAIDSIGNIKWEWESGVNEEAITMGLMKTSNNEYIYTTGTVTYPNIFTAEIQLKVIKRDSNFNLLWSLDINPFPAPLINTMDITPTGDGHYAVVGNWNTIDSSNTMLDYGWTGGCIVKFTEDGEKLWDVCDTIANTNEYNFHNSTQAFRGITSLPSGSIIAAGVINRYDNTAQYWRSIGWLYKVTADGCMDTLCNLSTALFSPPKLSTEIKVFPNPTEGLIHLEIPEDYKNSFLQVYNIQGQEVYQNNEVSVGKTQLDMSFLKSGIYFIKIMGERNQHFSTVKFVKK